MRDVYTITIALYGLFLRFAAVFNVKARQWVSGRRDLFMRLEAALKETGMDSCPVTWFHVSSLGEFEQGLPVMEACRKRRPGKKILLTFFSPSGYEIRKNHPAADLVFYLPSDTPGNVRRFLDIVRPERVFFVKYDFWFNYLKAIRDRGIPLYFISALFRKEQFFFQWYGRWFRRQLGTVSHFFVQDPASGELLASAGIRKYTVTGDTRFDRVYEIAARSEGVPLVERFCDGRPAMVIGSSWDPDEEVCLPLINAGTTGLKFIIAPPRATRSRASRNLR